MWEEEGSSGDGIGGKIGERSDYRSDDGIVEI